MTVIIAKRLGSVSSQSQHILHESVVLTDGHLRLGSSICVSVIRCVESLDGELQVSGDSLEAVVKSIHFSFAAGHV